MKITVSIKNNKQNININIDDELTIEFVLNILKQKNLIQNYNDFVYSHRLMRKFEINKTFKENMIQEGDCLDVN